MLSFRRLQPLLLAGTCLCVCGTPVRLPDVKPEYDHDCYGQCISSRTTVGSTHSADEKPEPSGSEHAMGLMWKVGVGGGAGPHGQPEGTAPVTQIEKGYILDGRLGMREAGGEAWSQRREAEKVGSTSEMGEAQRPSETASVLPDTPVIGEAILNPTGGRQQLDIAVTTTRLPPDGFLVRESKDQDGEDRTKTLGYGDSPEPESSFLPSAPDPGERIQKLTSHSSVPPMVFVSRQTSTPLSITSHDGATMSSLPEPLLPEMGPNLMPREDGPESLWTEATRLSGGK